MKTAIMNIHYTTISLSSDFFIDIYITLTLHSQRYSTVVFERNTVWWNNPNRIYSSARKREKEKKKLRREWKSHFQLSRPLFPSTQEMHMTGYESAVAHKGVPSQFDWQISYLKTSQCCFYCNLLMKQSKIHMESQVKMIYFMKEEKLEIILAFWGLLICLLS